MKTCPGLAHKLSRERQYHQKGTVCSKTDKEIENLIGREIYLGEYEGKHSEVYGTVDKKDITLVSDNPVVLETIGNFGINPLEFLEE